MNLQNPYEAIKSIKGCRWTVRSGGKESLEFDKDNQKKLHGGEIQKQPDLYETSWKWEKLPATTVVLFLG